MDKEYGREHVPLIAQVQPNRNRPDQVVGFIGPQICFFERGSAQPTAGKPVEVMITRALYGRHSADHDRPGAPDYSRINALFVVVVDPNQHMLVAIDGFECSGSMCRTTAHGRETTGRGPLSSADVHPPRLTGESRAAWINRTRGHMWLTPGRSGIRVADNVNADFFGSGRERATKTPTNVWVERSEVAERAGCGVRVVGLSRIDDGEWAALVRRKDPASAP